MKHTSLFLLLTFLLGLLRILLENRSLMKLAKK